MKQVWKFKVRQEVVMPVGSRIVAVALKHEGREHPGGVFYVWAEVDTRITATTTRFFRVVATGAWVGDSDIYIGTVHDDPFVWHIYELPGRPQEA